MAKDEHGLDLAFEEADDEVIDLLEVVKPGKTVSKSKAKASDADEDFSADLESMLDTLSKVEQAKAAEEDAQPFPDPTPVSHVVDANESLDMPSMDDLDHILNTLGAPKQSSSSVESADVPDIPSFDDMPDLDAVPVAKSSAAPAAPLSEEDDLLAGLGLDDLDDHLSTPVAASAPLPETIPVDLEGLPPDIHAADSPAFSASLEEEDLFSLDTAVGDIASESLEIEHMPKPSPPPPAPAEPKSAKPVQAAAPTAAAQKAAQAAAQNIAQKAEQNIEQAFAQKTPAAAKEDALPPPVEAPSDSPAAPRFDEVDLNELDALLDDMLATAPASGPKPAGAAASESGPASQTGMPPETGVSGEAAVAAGAAPASSSELASLRTDMDALRRDLAAMRPADTPPGPSALEAKIEDMELTLHNLDNRMTLLEGRQGEMDSRMTSLEAQQSDLHANIEKLAAEAAAKIIREELAALLKSGF